jgi:adenosylhomocysteine nucleosidase
MTIIAIIAALDRELAPLVRSWQSTRITEQGRAFRVFQHENVVAVAGGIGSHAAALAASAIVRHLKPQALISAGLAGALVDHLQIGAVITPSIVIDAATEKQYRNEPGEGILVSSGEVAGSASKQSLADRFHASIVDMEAAAVAEIAAQQGLTFRCVKAISDDAAFEMPPLNRFIDQHGRFQNARFTFWLLAHPQYWHRALTLARNSSRASIALCKWLEEHVCKELQNESIDRIKGAELSQIKH